MFAKNISITINKMFTCLKYNKVIYIFSNLLVLPATWIPNIDFLSNLALKKSYRIKDLEITAGLQIRNLFDEKYFDNIRLNAFGNRFYEPASLRSYLFSLSTNF